MDSENFTLILFYNNVVTADDGKGGAIFILDGDCEGVSSEDYFDLHHLHGNLAALKEYGQPYQPYF